MTFHHFEKALDELPDENMQKYFELFGDSEVVGKLREPTRSVLGYTMDIASYLDSVNLGDDYIVFGGYAVLSHLMEQYGEDAAVFWRGSKDIDMASTGEAHNALRGEYEVKGDSLSPNLPDKYTLKLVEDAEQECKIDLYTGDMDRRFYSPEKHNHFGVSLRVCDPLTLIEGKLFAPYEEDNHSVDIVRVLAALEQRGDKTMDQIVGFFTAEQKTDLLKRIRKGYELTKKGRLDIRPGDRFIGELEKELHKRRPINH